MQLKENKSVTKQNAKGGDYILLQKDLERVAQEKEQQPREAEERKKISKKGYTATWRPRGPKN